MQSLLSDSGSLLQVLIPIGFISSALILVPFKKKPGLCSYLALLVVLFGFIASWNLFFQIAANEHGYLDYFLGHSWNGDRFLSSGQPIGIVLRSDIFGALLVLLITGIGLLTTLYSIKYIPHLVKPHRIAYYYSLLLLLLGGLIGISLTGDCFNFYVFLEVASISSYALVAMSREKQALEASFKYMLIGAFGSVLIVFGIALLFSATGTLNMAYASRQISMILKAEQKDDGGGHMTAHTESKAHGGRHEAAHNEHKTHDGGHEITPDGPGSDMSHLANFKHLIYASLALFVIGFSIKSAFFPTHAWLADAHPAAPSSISAILSGLVVKATGVFLFIRFLFTVFSIHTNHLGDLLSPMFLIVAVVTTIGGSLFAIAQTDLKRMLAYSTVAQMGYILLGIGLITPAGLEGSILHIINHALIKSLLFLCAGAIIYKTGIRDIRQMTRIGYRMPLTMACFTLGALSMVGIPPLNGFMSKFALAEASLDAGAPFLVIVLLISSLLNAIYYLRVVGIAYFSTGHHDQKTLTRTEVPWEMAVPLMVLAISLIYFGLKAGMMRDIIKPAVQVLWS